MTTITARKAKKIFDVSAQSLDAAGVKCVKQKGLQARYEVQDIEKKMKSGKLKPERYFKLII